MNRRVFFGSLGLFLAAAAAAPAQQAVILVRHAEKEIDPAKIAGLADKDIPLRKAGETRAKALAEHLKGSAIDAVYVSFAKRTQQTAAPLLEALHQDQHVLGSNSIQQLGVQHKDQVVLIVAHSAGALGVPQFIDQITGKANGMTIGENEYDSIFILVPKKDGTWSVIRARYGAR